MNPQESVQTLYDICDSLISLLIKDSDIFQKQLSQLRDIRADLSAKPTQQVGFFEHAGIG